MLGPGDGEVQIYGPARARTTISARTGSRDIHQTVWEIGSGRSPVVVNPQAEEVLYTASGSGRCQIGGSLHDLAPGTGAFVPPGKPYYLENPNPELLVVIAVCCPQDAGRIIGGPAPPAAAESRPLTVCEQEQQPLAAGADREFKYLVDARLGCAGVTQFVGFIPPSKAPFHHHTYEEAIYIVQGEGIVHTESGSAPYGPGSCIYLPRLVKHCLENPGTTPVRLVGVFHPAGSPAAAYED